jgi:hypothetical protein
MVLPQLVLSAGRPGTLGSWRIKMRIRGCSCRHAAHTGRKKSTPVDTHFKWLFSRAIQFSDEHLEHTGQSLFDQTKGICLTRGSADSGIGISWASVINVTQGMADKSRIVINCLDDAHLRCGRGDPATN